MSRSSIFSCVRVVSDADAPALNVYSASPKSLAFQSALKPWRERGRGRELVLELVRGGDDGVGAAVDAGILLDLHAEPAVDVERRGRRGDELIADTRARRHQVVDVLELIPQVLEVAEHIPRVS